MQKDVTVVQGWQQTQRMKSVSHMDGKRWPCDSYVQAHCQNIWPSDIQAKYAVETGTETGTPPIISNLQKYTTNSIAIGWCGLYVMTHTGVSKSQNVKL